MKNNTMKFLLASVIVAATFLPVLAQDVYVSYNDEDQYGNFTNKLIPYYLWGCGCTCTAGAMTLAYWDNYGPIGTQWGKYTSWGRLIDYYIDEPTMETYTDGEGDHFRWLNYATPCLARPMTIVHLALHMDTDAPDGGTDRENQHTGVNAYVDSKGYGDNWASRYYKEWWEVWKNEVYEEIRDEIDADYPCLCSVPGHSICVWGYNNSNDVFFVYDTWNEYRHDWDQDEFDNLNRVHPQGGHYEEDVELHAPNGGETWGAGTEHTIQWYQYGAAGSVALDNVDLFYSVDGGLTFTNIVTYNTSSPGWNSYTWTIPSGLNATRMRIKIDGWGGWDDLYSEDGSQTNFTVLPMLPAPTGFSASKDTYTDRIRLVWSAVSGATYYQIFRNTVNDPDTATVIQSSYTGTSYNDYSVNSDIVYYYWVRGHNTNQIGAFATDWGRRHQTYGSLTVTIYPVEVRSQARWRLTTGGDTSWHESGYTLNNVITDPYTLQSLAVAGWENPDDQIVNIAEGANNASLTYIALPVLSTMTPSSGPCGSYVTITGTNFGATQGAVKFSDVASNLITSWTDTQIVCRVPFAGLPSSSTVVVTNSVGVVSYNSLAFTVTTPSQIRVSTTGTPGRENGTTTWPFCTVQKGIDAAENGVEVILNQGTYTGTGNRNIDFNGKDIVVRSTSPTNPQTVAATIIDCQSGGRGIIIDGGESALAKVQGLTITNGYNSSGGAGIYCVGSSPVIENCRILNCTAGTHGGGVFLDGGAAGVHNSYIRGCHAIYGGGVYMKNNASPVLDHSLIVDNTATSGGGLCMVSSTATLEQMTVANNAAASSGGVGYVMDSD
ncbi:MAG: IPT/TIG domain-containing protein, partial [Sedimentisphaerales bacterium]|nr:IPT/TIG domain-containing protein [Sedimentisphaerales bacterium]